MTMHVSTPVSSWTIDPDDPRAPPEHVWDALSPAERQRVVDSLPSEFEVSEAQPPEGDLHFNAKVAARDTLGAHFARTDRRVYVACELPIYYPNEKVFSPDVAAVLDVEIRSREKWVVKTEGKGLDFALEVIVSGKRRKDLQTNVERYARLGINEYFVFDRGRLQLFGFRLPATGARVYEPITIQAGRLTSHVLELELRIDGNRLRFMYGMAALPDASELIASLERMVDDVEHRIRAAESRAEEETRLREEETRLREEETRLREEETRLREEETRLREAAEHRLAEALAEIERLKAERGDR